MSYFVPDAYSNQWVFYPNSQSNGSHSHKGNEKVTKRNGVWQLRSCNYCNSLTQESIPALWHWQDEQVTNSVRVVQHPQPISIHHEMVLLSEDHTKGLSALTATQTAAVLAAMQDGYSRLSPLGRVIMYGNRHFPPNNSLSHPHCHVLLLPPQVSLEEFTLQPAEHVVEESDLFVSYCPSYSQWPYEIWISSRDIHKQLSIDFNRESFLNIVGQQRLSLSKMLLSSLKRIEKVVPTSLYTYYLHPYDPWYIRIMPRLKDRGNFEIATGLVINPVSPAKAAEILHRAVVH